METVFKLYRDTVESCPVCARAVGFRLPCTTCEGKGKLQIKIYVAPYAPEPIKCKVKKIK